MSTARGTWAIAICFVVFVGRPTAAADAPANPDRPLNVLFIVSDDHQHTALGCAGHPIVQTPHLDKLAQTGVRFTHAFVELPICTPSRASYLTGRFAASNHITFFGMQTALDSPTWPQALGSHGYQTAFTGKWHNAPDFAKYGFAWSANVFMAGMGGYTNPKLIQKPDDKPTEVQGEITQLVTDSAVRFLHERDARKPFFLYVAYTAPHDPRTPPPEYERRYDPDRMPLPANFRPKPEPDPGTLNIRDEKLLPVPRDPAAVRLEIARYYALITYLDDQIGRIFSALEETGRVNDTIVVFAGDNGLTLGAHGLLGKQTLHEEGVRVPLIIRNPRLDVHGQARDGLVYLTDLMPTVLDWTGTPAPKAAEGRSLADLYAGKTQRVRDAVFGRYDEKDLQLFRSIRTERFKLIQYLQLGIEQLFDLEQDPYEMKDLAGKPELQATQRQLHERLLQWRNEQDAIEATWTKPFTKPVEKGSTHP